MYWLSALVLGIGLNLSSALILMLPSIRRRRPIRNTLIALTLLGAMITIAGLAGYFIAQR